jgi:prolyl 4-hydroxylase
MQNVDSEWQEWVDTNLARGCDTQELHNIMRNNGFATDIIKQMMGDSYPSEPSQENNDNPIDYLALSQTMDKHLEKTGAVPLENDALQIYTIDNFLTAEECERLVTLTEAGLQPSTVTHDNGDKAFRTSETCHLDPNNAFVKYIDEKIAQTLGVNPSFSEAIQAQRYAIGQEFKAHHDYFAPDMDIYSDFTEQMGQRTWTFMIYLNDTRQGGGTHFPYLDQIFYPQQGKAVIWNNLYPDGVPNRNTLHHGMPVEAGKKVIITKWFRENGHGNMFYEEAETVTQ